MTPDLKTAARAALVEQIARICEPEGFYHGQWAVPSHRADGLAKATTILAAIEPAIRAAALEEAAREAEARDLSIMSSTVVDIEARKIAAAIRALKDKPS